ncbi:MAG: response regulator [Deltaproteobacteria bacterium]|nr:response regulator [Deltaproteobacteria bacterium]
MVETALFVDDEENVLHSLERLFADRGVQFLGAGSAEEALKIIREEEVAVLVSDNRMPGMTGIALHAGVKEISPDTIRILMTGHADLQTAMDAINRGEVFRFVVKPWDNEKLTRIVEDGLNRYRVVRSLKKADEATLLSLAQAVELKDPYTRGHCDRVAQYALMLAGAFDLPEEVRREIKYGSWLHDCGKIGVAESILNYAGPLNEKQFKMIKQHPTWGAEVARQAQLSERIVNIILCHHEKYDGSGYPSGRKGPEIPFEARIVSVADVYDALVTHRPYKKGFSPEKSREVLLSLRGSSFDPEILDTFLGLSVETKRPGKEPVHA